MSTTVSSLFSSLASAATTSTSSSTSSSAISSSDFLSLFTTQLENQDPTDPMDTSTMTNQMAMLSIVSQCEDMNTTLSSILTAQNGANVTSAVGYIGRTITANSDEIDLSDGSATINYSLPSAASSATIAVYNSSGNEVTTLSGGTSSGDNSVTWDGTDSSGNTVDDGVYTVKITATDSSGDSVTATPYVTGKVTGVDSSSGEIKLQLGSISASLSDITGVST